MGLSVAAAKFVTTGESFTGIGRSFGATCDMALRLLKSPATERKFAVIGESWHGIAGTSEITAVGTVTIIVIAVGGMIATAGGILTGGKIAA